MIFDHLSTLKLRPLSLLLLLSLFCFARGTEETPPILQTLTAEHPRLMLTEDALTELKLKAQTDEVLQRFIHKVIEDADAQLEEPPLKHRARLLGTSRTCIDRIYTLGIAWRWTGNSKYAEKIKENLIAVCAFPNWNPRHFLDAAEMSHAVAVGYDWTYHYLDEESRETIKTALIDKGLTPGIERYKRGYHHFTYAYNWNQVCNGSLLIGALAIAESDPDTATFIIENALKNLPTALASFAPDGVWAEGISYWKYATSYTAFALTALQTALGNDFDLSSSPGLDKTGYIPIDFTGPTGLYLSYADSADFKKHSSAHPLFWLAQTYHNTDFSDAEHRQITPKDISPFHIIWYTPPSGKSATTRKLDHLVKGQVETALFRSSWDDPNALFVGVKAGYNQAHHGHLDLGNFELDALGVRWARDLGADSYSLPQYWTYQEGGTRWTYYRLNSFSHNVPILGNQNQNADAVAKLTRFESGDTTSFAQIDLTEAYAAHATSAHRGIALVQNRRAVLIQDEFTIEHACEINWGMTTDSKITIETPQRARLTLQGKELIAQILSPNNATFSIESAEQPPPQKSNTGVSRLIAHLPESEGQVTLSILLSPVWQEGETVTTADLNPLKEW